MRALPAVLLLLAACGDDAPSWSAWFEGGPRTTVSVTAWRGTLRLGNSTNGRIEFSVRGAPAPDPKRSWILRDEGRGRVALVVPEDAKDWDLEIEVAAPPGVSVSCACADARVEVVGAWGRIEVKAGGGVTARVERADSGELESRAGSVVYEAAAGPTGELYVKAARGDVTIRLPATWEGQIDCTTQGGELDAPPHKNLQTLWDEDRKHFVGRVGPPTKEKWMAAVWGSSLNGNVSVRIGD